MEVSSYHAFLLLPFDFEQLPGHDNELWLCWISEWVGDIICCSARAERLCPRGTSARVSDKLALAIMAIITTPSLSWSFPFHFVLTSTATTRVSG